MPVAPDSIALEHHSADAAAELLDELCEVYADAYGVDPKENKADAFRNRAEGALGAKNFDLVTARQGDELIGFVFGYSLRADRGWWDGLDPEPSPGFARETGTRTAVVAEIEVRRAWQGKGVGSALQKEFLARRTEERATLSTNPAAVETQALYERWGWTRMGIIPGKPGSYFREYVLFVLPLSPEPK